MKLKKAQLKELIIKEVRKIALTEGWLDAIEKAEKLKAQNSKASALNEGAELAQQKSSPEEPKVELVEVKRLTEEFKRMKALVDFRSPLLKKDD
jgi:peptidoglycan hydrolase CwlO-like protein